MEKYLLKKHYENIYFNSTLVKAVKQKIKVTFFISKIGLKYK
jgi:hypothetical protein